MEEQQQEKPKKKRSHKVLAAKIAWAGVVGALPVAWVHQHTDGFTRLPEKAAGVTHAFPQDSADRADLTKQFQLNFNSVITGYAARDRQVDFSEEELKFGAQEFSTYELVKESRTISGYYGALFHDSRTGRNMIHMAGMNWSLNPSTMLPDLLAATLSAANNSTTQTGDAIAFALECEKFCKTKYGQGIDVVTGHSLGAANAGMVAAGGLLGPKTRYFLYDGPGFTDVTVDYAAERFGLSAKQVEANLRNQCFSFVFTPNSYNLCGQQAGIAATVNNDKNRGRIYPMEHMFNDKFVKRLGELETVNQRDDSQESRAPSAIIAICLALAALPWLVPPAVRGVRRRTASYTREAMKDVDTPFKAWAQDAQMDTGQQSAAR